VLQFARGVKLDQKFETGDFGIKGCLVLGSFPTGI